MALAMAGMTSCRGRQSAWLCGRGEENGAGCEDGTPGGGISCCVVFMYVGSVGKSVDVD